MTVSILLDKTSSVSQELEFRRRNLFLAPLQYQYTACKTLSQFHHTPAMK